MPAAHHLSSRAAMRYPGGPNHRDARHRNGNGNGSAGGSAGASDARVAELFGRYHRDGDQAAREALVERFLPLARQLARRFHRGGESLDDLIQVASLGLLKAIDRFEPARGFAFSSYATPTIAGELKRYYRDHGWAVRVPRALQERVIRVKRAIDELAGRTGRSPSVHELSEFLELSVEEVLSAMEAGDAHHARSFDAPRGDQEDGDGYADRLGSVDDHYELAEDVASLAPALAALSHRDQVILRLRFVEELSQSQVADKLGVSQMQVSRLQRKALARVREAVLAESPDGTTAAGAPLLAQAGGAMNASGSR